mgnify:FL=1
MEKFSWKGHSAMLLANTSWGLMSPLAKVVMAGGVVTPFVLTDLRIFGAMVLFWAVSLFQKPEHVPPRDMLRLFAASLLAIVFNQGSFIFGVKLSSPADASIITTSMPLWAMLLAAVFLREPVTGKKVAGIAFGAGGALMLILGSRCASHTWRPACAFRPTELCHISCPVQEFYMPLFACDGDEVDVYLCFSLHASVLIFESCGNRLVCAWMGRCACRGVYRGVCHVCELYVYHCRAEESASHGGWNVQLRAARSGVCRDGLSRARLVQCDEGACRGDDFCGRVSRHNEQEPRRRAPRGTTVTCAMKSAPCLCRHDADHIMKL